MTAVSNPKRNPPIAAAEMRITNDTGGLVATEGGIVFTANVARMRRL
jgi:hypothetical protein